MGRAYWMLVADPMDETQLCNGKREVIIISDNAFFLLAFHLRHWFIATDPRVMYSEPAKFVAKLRDMKTDKNIILFKCEFGAGHSSKSGR